MEPEDPAPLYRGYRPLLYFIPFVGYFLNLRDYYKAYKSSLMKKLFTMLENTALYFGVGFIARQAFRIGSILVFFQLASAVWLLAGLIEAAIIRKWGGHLPLLGWGKLKAASRKDFTIFMLFMYLQTMTFILTGFYVASLLRF